MYDRKDLSCDPDLSKHREFLASLFPTDEFLLLTPEEKKTCTTGVKKRKLKDNNKAFVQSPKLIQKETIATTPFYNILHHNNKSLYPLLLTVNVF